MIILNAKLFSISKNLSLFFEWYVFINCMNSWKYEFDSKNLRFHDSKIFSKIECEICEICWRIWYEEICEICWRIWLTVIDATWFVFSKCFVMIKTKKFVCDFWFVITIEKSNDCCIDCFFWKICAEICWRCMNMIRWKIWCIDWSK